MKLVYPGKLHKAATNVTVSTLLQWLKISTRTLWSQRSDATVERMENEDHESMKRKRFAVLKDLPQVLSLSESATASPEEKASLLSIFQSESQSVLHADD